MNDLITAEQDPQENLASCLLSPGTLFNHEPGKCGVLTSWRTDTLAQNSDSIVTIRKDQVLRHSRAKISIDHFVPEKQPDLAGHIRNADFFINDASGNLIVMEAKLHAGVVVGGAGQMWIEHLVLSVDDQMKLIDRWYEEFDWKTLADLNVVVAQEVARVKKELYRLKRIANWIKRRIFGSGYTIDIRSSYRKKTYGVFKNLDDEDAIA